MINTYSYKDHISNSKILVTPYGEIRAGFIALALEKNRKATPFVEEAKALKAIASKVSNPRDLLKLIEIKSSILTAAGISDKACSHLEEKDKAQAILGLIENFLEPAGSDFVDELVFRFLLTRGDSLGGSMRNIVGSIGERKLTRAILSTLAIEGKSFHWLHSKSNKWIPGDKNDVDIELELKGLSWISNDLPRTLIYNLTVPMIKKNVDLCLFNCDFSSIIFGKKNKSAHYQPELYIALGELKAGIDPAGADEHWKTANHALSRIRKYFKKKSLSPKTFFIGAAIEDAMAKEIYKDLRNKILSNAANLTKEEQLFSLCRWLIHI
ncbi:MAG: AvaI/BsoBI family type II restriction endonuclease [Burkholderiales bacterium]